MRKLTLGLFAVLGCLALILPLTAQEGFPLKGSWLGDWGEGTTNRNQVFVVFDWDGKVISGAINPGTEMIAVKNASLTPTPIAPPPGTAAAAPAGGGGGGGRGGRGVAVAQVHKAQLARPLQVEPLLELRSGGAAPAGGGQPLLYRHCPASTALLAELLKAEVEVAVAMAPDRQPLQQSNGSFTSKATAKTARERRSTM